MTDLATVRKNVKTLLDNHESEDTIDHYLAENNLTAAQLRGGKPATPAAAPSVSPAAPLVGVSGDPTDPKSPAYQPSEITDTTPSGGQPGDQFNPQSNRWLEYQNNLREDGAPHTGGNPSAASKAAQNSKAPDKSDTLGSDWQAALVGAADGVTFGALPKVGAGIEAAYGKLAHGKDFSKTYDLALNDNRMTMERLKNDHWKSSLAGEVAGGIAVPFGIGAKFVKGGKAGAEVALTGVKTLEEARVALAAASKARLAVGAIDGGTYGAIHGAVTSDGGLKERAGQALIEGASGAAIGAAVAPLAHKVFNKSASFAEKQIKNNPYAQVHAEIAQDLADVVSAKGLNPLAPKGRSALTAREINDVAASYHERIAAQAKGSGATPTELEAIQTIASKHISATDDEINALRGTVAGDAAADGLIKSRELYRLTPEIRKGGTGAFINGAITLGSSVTGAAALGPAGALAGAAVRPLLRNVIEGEAARVNAAGKVLKGLKGYQKVTEALGGTGQKESQSALLRAYTDATEGKVAAAADSAASKTQAAADKATAKAQTLADAQSASSDKARAWHEEQTTKLDAMMDAHGEERLNGTIPAKDMKAFRTSIKSDTIDPRDVALAATGTGSEAQLGNKAAARNRALAKLQATADNFDLDAPPPPAVAVKPEPKARPLAPEHQAVTDNIAAGIPGTSGVQKAFADRVGVSVPDMLRGLEGIRNRFPGMGPEIDRIANNYPTMKSRGIADALVPAIKQHLTDDGTMAASRLATEAANQRATARMAAEATALAGKPKALPATVSNPELPIAAPPKPQIASDGLPAQDGKNLTLPADGPLPAPTVAPPVAEVPNADQLFLQQSAKDGVVAPKGPLKVDVSEDVAPMVTPQVRPEPTPQAPVMRPVDRPVQHQAGKERYQAQADAAKNDLYGDESLSDNVFAAIPNVADRIKHDFKTTSEASDFIHNDVVPDLEINGATPAEIQTTVDHLHNIANAKPYATPAELEAGTAARPSGRPRKK
ncbi:hypothetical protein D3Y57_05500 [Sphingomonas paeninsulae]|uniref:Uncharacterized protein n=1 Tax=Sphingomonas paeninsulae TaxID=2319844 RepID=A0A494TK83_SPHPE|nr:hypothetical protein [Sphingomonas paeninsulae]AYJ85535.1 hypothetical protein D3Y57_05500 [Sphingomonas paeninsulae]